MKKADQIVRIKNNKSKINIFRSKDLKFSRIQFIFQIDCIID